MQLALDLRLKVQAQPPAYREGSLLEEPPKRGAKKRCKEVQVQCKGKQTTGVGRTL